MPKITQKTGFAIYSEVEDAIAPLQSVITILNNTVDLYRLELDELDDVSAHYLVSHSSELGDVMYLATRTLKEILEKIRNIDQTEERPDIEPKDDSKCLGVL